MRQTTNLPHARVYRHWLKTDAWKALEGFPDRVVNNTRYLYAEAVQSPFMLGRDENNRVLLAFNLDVVKALSTG